MPLMPVASVVNAASGGAMVQLYDNTASGAIASWDVSGISQAYSQLQLFLSCRGSTALSNLDACLRFNNDSGANYYWERIYASITTPGCAQGLAQTSGSIADISGSIATANYGSEYLITIPNYAGTTFFKRAFSHGGRSDGAGSGSQVWNGYEAQWISTAAINQVTVFPISGNFIAGSRLTIYGLL